MPISHSLAHIELQRILDILGLDTRRVLGPTMRTVTHPASIREAQSDLAITFSERADARALRVIQSTQAGVVLCPDEPTVDTVDRGERTLIVVDKPRLSFMRLLEALFAEPRPVGIHPTATIHSAARIHPDVYIGPCTYVGECEIGEGTVIYGNVHIYSQTRIGRNAVIHAGVVIGADGFNFHRDETGALKKFPHFNGVIIEDDVEIGANTCIDRGTLSDTFVGAGTKIDNLVHIGHAAKVGRQCEIAVGAIIGGNTVLGANIWVGPGVILSHSLRIGDGASIMFGAVVAHHVPPTQRVSGYFAVDHDQFMAAWYKQLRGTRSST